jgi:hypothetical protein
LTRWLNFDETCMELRLGGKAVRSMLNRGILVGYQVPRSRGDNRAKSKMGAWRILNPGEKFVRYLHESNRRLEHVPLFSGTEVAEILGVKPGTIRQLKRRGLLKGEASDGRTLYSVRELRRFLRRRELKSQKAGRRLYSPILIHWARGLVQNDSSVQARALNDLLNEAVPLPGSIKSHYVVKLWEHFDAVNALLQAVKGSHTRGYASSDMTSRPSDQIY